MSITEMPESIGLDISTSASITEKTNSRRKVTKNISRNIFNNMYQTPETLFNSIAASQAIGTYTINKKTIDREPKKDVLPELRKPHPTKNKNIDEIII
jgi:hypothetical protein